jgi:hypothetical protein
MQDRLAFLHMLEQLKVSGLRCSVHLTGNGPGAEALLIAGVSRFKNDLAGFEKACNNLKGECTTGKPPAIVNNKLKIYIITVWPITCTAWR